MARISMTISEMANFLKAIGQEDMTFAELDVAIQGKLERPPVPPSVPLDGSEEFWQFVDDMGWEKTGGDYGELRKLFMQENWTTSQLKEFEEEYCYHAGRIADTLEKHPDLYFGGGDDYTFMDLPGEIIGRGRECFLAHVDDAVKLSRFGQEEDIKECFSYIFHEDEDDEEKEFGEWLQKSKLIGVLRDLRNTFKLERHSKD